MLNRKMAAQVSRRFGLDAEQSFGMRRKERCHEIQKLVNKKGTKNFLRAVCLRRKKIMLPQNACGNTEWFQCLYKN